MTFFVNTIIAAAALSIGILSPSLYRRSLHPTIKKKIPFSIYVKFDVAVRFRSFLHRLGGVSHKLEVIPDVTMITPGIIRILGKNPGRMTLRGTNTYLLGEGAHRILIDSSDGNAAFMKNLLDVCSSQGVKSVDLLITHSHYDHIGGVLRLREAFPHMKMWKFMPPSGQGQVTISNKEAEALLIQPLSLDKRFRIPSIRKHESIGVLRAEYMPGHCVDHVCFILESPGQVALFSGDCILGEGSCMFDSLRELMISLRRLQELSPTVIYPAHGPIVKNAMMKIQEYITHREEREQEIITTLHNSTTPLSSKELVHIIYASQKLPRLLQYVARRAVTKHLDKLCHDDQVVGHTSKWWWSTTRYTLKQKNL